MSLSPKAAKGSLNRMKAERAARRASKTKYTIEPSPGNPTPTAVNPGRYDVAGRYIGASSPVQLPDGRGMSAKMAAIIQQNPSAYPGYANPSQGTPRYTYKA